MSLSTQNSNPLLYQMYLSAFSFDYFYLKHSTKLAKICSSYHLATGLPNRQLCWYYFDFGRIFWFSPHRGDIVTIAPIKVKFGRLMHTTLYGVVCMRNKMSDRRGYTKTGYGNVDMEENGKYKLERPRIQ